MIGSWWPVLWLYRGHSYFKLQSKATKPVTSYRVYCMRKLNDYNAYIKATVQRLSQENICVTLPWRHICFMPSLLLCNIKQQKPLRSDIFIFSILCGCLYQMEVFLYNELLILWPYPSIHPSEPFFAHCNTLLYNISQFKYYKDKLSRGKRFRKLKNVFIPFLHLSIS